MTSITIRTGTNRPEKPDHPLTSGEFETPTCSKEKLTETTNLSTTAFPRIESETFQNLPQNLSPDNESIERQSSEHNCDLKDGVPPDDSTLLARFLPKESAEKENASLNNIDNSIKTPELQELPFSSEVPDDQATSKSTEASELAVLDPVKASTVETQNTDDAEMGDSAVTTVLGTGHSPENDPDHSMLKFAVFEVQDLTEELKKLRDLLDTLAFSEGFEPMVPQEGSDDLASEPTKDIVIPVVFSGNSTADRADIRYESPRKTIHQIDTSESLPVSEAIVNGRLKSLNVDCKSQSESSYCSAFESCDINGYSEERCCFMSFSQEILAAVK